jgi:hypothetical protein
MDKNFNYFEAIVSVTEKYLGPASERFIKRQIEFHLQKDPKTINKSDVESLKDNVGVALGLLVNDRVLVDQAVKDIESIQA